MNGQPYTPRPGTVPFRAIAHLETLDHGAEQTTAQIAEAIGVPSNNLMPSLMAALDGGVLFRRQKDHSHPKSPFFWSLVDHTEPTGAAAASRRPPRAAKETAPQGTATQALAEPTNGVGDDAGRVVWAAAPRGLSTESTKGDKREGMAPEACESATGRGKNVAPALATPPVHGSPGVGPMGIGQPADAGPAGGMRVALWSDNELVIERPGQPRVVFDKVETRKLLDYLFRMEGG